MPATLTNTKTADEKVSILVVDDRPDKLLSYEVMLAGLNQNVVRATSGREALRCLLQQDFAVILLDVNMPGMDGFETAAMIRQRPRSEATPIIFISAVNDTINHVSRGYSLGAVDYILTPVVPEILRAKIGVFVELFKKTEQVKRQGEERAQLIREQTARAEAEMQQQRLEFLADASNALAASLDYEQTFQTLARIIVPRLADFCILEVAVENGGMRRVAIAHKDSEREPRLCNEDNAAGPVLAISHSARKVISVGKSQLRSRVDENDLRDLFDREQDREFIRSLSPGAIITVPFLAHEHILGALTIVSTSSQRVLGQRELSLAEELAQRAAIALDNAALYKAAEQARWDAERASLAKDRFIAMLSHELRTPLTPVLASVCAMECEEDVPAAMQESLQVIRRNVELEARLIDDLLDLTRISRGKVQLSIEPVDAHMLLRNALDICRSEINAKQLREIIELGASRPRLNADPARLQQIFWNLIKNAVKFTPAGGTLAVRTANGDGKLRVEVIDSGVGIDQELLPKIFNAFEQGDRPQLGGLGLGLAISKALVELQHGQIFAESAGPGKGAKFTAIFPTSNDSQMMRARTAPVSTSERRSMRILLVEDHHDTNRSLTQLLQRRGYDVHSASSVDAALKLVRKQNFDVLISDIGLPDGSGTELMAKLKNGHSIFGIALTGFGMEEDVRRSREAGFDHHLVKPVDLNRLDSILQSGPAIRT